MRVKLKVDLPIVGIEEKGAVFEVVDTSHNHGLMYHLIGKDGEPFAAFSREVEVLSDE